MRTAGLPKYGFWLTKNFTEIPDHWRNLTKETFGNHTKSGEEGRRDREKELKKYGGRFYVRHKRVPAYTGADYTRIVDTAYFVGFRNEESWTAYLLRWS